MLQEMSHTRNSVTVRVPATSANLGPGFDTVGMALDMWSVASPRFVTKNEDPPRQRSSVATAA